MKELLPHLWALVVKSISNHIQKSQDWDLLVYLRGEDPEANARTTPPQDESIDLCCAWAVEFYTPAHMDRLVGKFRDLGWDTEYNRDPMMNPVNWLNGLRRFQSGGAWLNIGSLHPPDSRSTFGISRRTSELPTDIEYANAWMYSVTPSLISIVVCFVLNEDRSGMFDRSLRADRQTFPTQAASGTQYHEPWKQKSDEIGDLRERVSSELQTWFSANLPGLFSSGLLDGNIPTCELVTLQEGSPFPSLAEEEGPPPEYLRLLGVSHDLEAWKSKSIPSLKFSVAQDWSNSPQHHSILAANVNRLTESIPDGYSGECRPNRIHFVDSMMWKLIAIWAILPMFEGYTQHLSRVRSSTTLSNTTLQPPVKVLKNLGRHISYSVDIAAVTAELTNHAERQFARSHDIDPFEPCNPEIYREKLSLSDYLNRIIGKQARWLQETDVSIRSQLTQYGTLIGATESVRVQKRVTLLTWLLVMLAIATLVAPLLPAIVSLELHRLLSFLVDLWL